jgi:hypothetical protein
MPRACPERAVLATPPSAGEAEPIAGGVLRRRRRAFLGWGELARGSDAPFLSVYRGRIGDAITMKSQRLTPGDLLGAGRVGR